MQSPCVCMRSAESEVHKYFLHVSQVYFYMYLFLCISLSSASKLFAVGTWHSWSGSYAQLHYLWPNQTDFTCISIRLSCRYLRIIVICISICIHMYNITADQAHMWTNQTDFTSTSISVSHMYFCKSLYVFLSVNTFTASQLILSSHVN